MESVSNFIKDHTYLCVCTLGLAVLGYLGYRAVQWIINKCHKTEAIDRVAQGAISSSSSQKPSTGDHPIKNPKIEPISSNSSATQSGAGQEAEGKRHLAAATTIQRIVRGRLARLAFKKMQAERLEQQRSASARTIQSAWREHFGRRQALLAPLLKQAQPFIDDLTLLEGVPVERNGQTSVYFPSGLPVVLKQIDPSSSQKSLSQMRKYQKLCKARGYTHLMIPQAFIYKGFIVESKLNTAECSMEEQMWRYAMNPTQFTEAVKEFADLVFQWPISRMDPVGLEHPYALFSSGPMGSHKSIFLSEGGKIGLVTYGCETKACLGAEALIGLFPYHYEEIIAVLDKISPDAPRRREYLEGRAREAKKRFDAIKSVYTSHANIIRNGADIGSASAIQVTDARKEEIKRSILTDAQNEILLPFNRIDLNKEDLSKVVDFFNKSFLGVLNKITDSLSGLIREKIDNNPISSVLQLTACRTIHGGPNYGWWKRLIQGMLPEFQNLSKKDWEWQVFANYLIYRVLDNLAKGGEIAYYNPCARMGIHMVC